MSPTQQLAIPTTKVPGHPASPHHFNSDFFIEGIPTKGERMKHLEDHVVFDSLFTNAEHWKLANEGISAVPANAEKTRSFTFRSGRESRVVKTAESALTIAFALYVPSDSAAHHWHHDNEVKWPVPKEVEREEGGFLFVQRELDGISEGWLDAKSYGEFKDDKVRYWRESRLWCYEVYNLELHGCELVFREHRLFCVPVKDGDRIPGHEGLDKPENRKERDFINGLRVNRSVAKRVYEPVRRRQRVKVFVRF